ncbi:MAG: GTP 3',8-cyclase MoaA [Gammaproteobacteria bacterium]|jgi:cyclic pyranopterin phosphate synthase|nr:GTP 3',8-cyclase MoaA [Gammaproteobacteria bacterium]
MKNENSQVTDTFGRAIHDLRVSITDRCNFRCVYCMPKQIFGSDYQFLDHKDILTYEEITRIVRIFVSCGVKKVRLTGGEPLLRREIERLIEMLAGVSGLDDLTLTTNGSPLTKEKARALKRAGLRRLTLSLDSLDDAVFQAMNDVSFPVARVLKAIDHAAAAGLSPIKINMVVKRDLNQDSILPMARYFRGTGHIVRFIEYMDVGASNGWRLDDVVPAAEIAEMINVEYPVEPIDSNYPGEVAKRWRYRDGGGEIGIISSVTQPFCGSCSRARLSAEGSLYTCLFATNGHDLRQVLRSDASDEEIKQLLSNIWSRRNDRYSVLRTAQAVALPKIEMSYIGG